MDREPPVGASTEISAVCRSCQAPDVEVVWRLAPAPYGDLFRDSREEARSLELHPLDLGVCRQCALLQLVGGVDIQEIYGNYLYRTSVTSTLSSYYAELATGLIRNLALKSGDLVVDVGSNDGSGLEPYQNAGIRVLGIEPSESHARAAALRGIPTINSFLSEECSAGAVAEFGQAALVCANYVAANVPDPLGFFSSLRAMLQPKGAISIITGYHPDQFAVGMFEYINHDHLSYFSVQSASELGAAIGLRLVSARRIEHKGGSIHLLFRPVEADVQANWSVTQLLQRENWLGANLPGIVEDLSRRVSALKVNLQEVLRSIKTEQIIGIGASISTTHLMYQLGFGHKVECLLDDDINKVGKFSPGLGIEVRGLSECTSRKERAAFLLAWQHERALLERLSSEGFDGEVVIPLPKPRTITLGTSVSQFGSTRSGTVS